MSKKKKRKCESVDKKNICKYAVYSSAWKIERQRRKEWMQNERGKKKKHHFQEYERQYGTLNATPRIPQQFAKITAVICRRLCSYCVPVLVRPYTYFHVHVHAQHLIYIHARRGAWYTRTHVARRWYYCERACSKQFPIRLPRSIHSAPSSLHSSPLPRLLNHFLLCPSYLHVLSPWMHPPVRTFIPIGCICT